VLTAFGVFQGMRAAAEVAWGEPSLRNRRVGIAGVGKVGRHLVGHLLADGADVVVTDVHEPAVTRVRAEYPLVEVADNTEDLIADDLDVYAPCALGGAINDDTIETLKATIVCGGANNQLEHPGLEDVLQSRGVFYAPDFCVNSGGLIQVADELDGFSFERAKARAATIYTTTKRVFEVAAQEGITSVLAASRIAERRMAEVGRLRGLWLG
jgi:valine dehydrogenase (NAD+)